MVYVSVLCYCASAESCSWFVGWSVLQLSNDAWFCSEPKEIPGRFGLVIVGRGMVGLSFLFCSKKIQPGMVEPGMVELGFLCCSKKKPAWHD